MPGGLPRGPSARIELRWQLVENPRVRGVALMREDGPDLGWTKVGEFQGDRTVLDGFVPTERYRFAAAAVYEDGSTDPEERWQVVDVVAMSHDDAPVRPTTPDAARFAVSQDGPVLNFAWEPNDDPVTEAYEIRVGPSWDAGVLVGRSIRTPYFRWHWWGPGTLTFRLRAVRRDGTYSSSEASVTFLVQALGDHVTVNTADEAGGGFGGTKTDTAVYSSGLELEDVPASGTGLTMVGSAITWPGWAKKKTTGTYQTSDRDLGALGVHRFEVDLGATVLKVSGLVGSQLTDVPCPVQVLGAETPLAIGARPSWWQNHLADGTPLHPLDVLVEIDTSQTDSPSSPSWDGWRAFTPGHYRCRWVRFRFTLRGYGLASPRITVLTLRTRRKNLKDEGSVTVTASPGPTAITFATPFTVAPVVTAVVGDDTGGLKVVASSVTKTGANLRVYGRRPAPITVDYDDFTIPGGTATEAFTPALFTIPNGWDVEKVLIKPTTRFDGTGITSALVALGTVSAPEDLVTDYEVGDPMTVAATEFKRVFGGKMYQVGSGATSIRLRIQTTGGDVVALSAGQLVIDLVLKPVAVDVIGPEVFTGTIKWTAHGT